MGDVRPVFSDLIHAPNRLRIMAALSTATELEFLALEDALSISTSLLSKQLKLLAEAGFLALDKRPRHWGPPRTWVRLTPAGRRAYVQHLTALRELIGDAPGPESPTI